MSNSSSSSDNEGERTYNEAAGDRLAVYSNLADRLIEIAEHGGDFTTSSPPPDDPGGGSSKIVQEKERSIEEKLLELHVEESIKERLHWSSHLNPCSNLLTLLCKREKCNRLVVTLHPNAEGYTIALANKDSQVVELAKLSYEQDDLLTSIDNQELPASLIDLLDFQFNANNTNTDSIYYNGCIIAEIRDERSIDPLRTIKSANKIVNPSQGNISHVLLRPTTQSIICDSNLIARQASNNGQNWTSEDQSILEGQLALATQQPLCLDPSPVVSVLARKAAINKQKFATVPMRRAVKKFSQVGINRKRKLETQAQSNPPDELKLHDFITSVREKQISENKMTSQEALHRHQTRVRANLRAANALAAAATGGLHNGFESGNTNEMMTVVNGNAAISAPHNQVSHLAPLLTDVSKHARAIPKRVEVNDNTPHIVEEYILETAERGTQRIYHTRLTIFQRLSNDEYLGELYVERDYRENDKKGSTCRFVLGTRPHALRYINQFTEIFTEEGRKSVKITHQVPNQPPRITLTPGMKERMNERLNDRQAAISAAQAQPQGALPNSSAASDGTNNVTSVSLASTSVTVNHNSALPISDAAQQPNITTASPMSSINVARRMPTASILQATLSAPPVNNSSNSASVPTVSTSLQQLPIHPVPQSTVIRQIVTPNVPSGPPPGVLQTQLTIQTNNIASNSGANHNQTTVMLPLTPHPNPHSASSSSLASPQQQLPSTPIDGQGSIAVPPSNILPSPINISIDQSSNNTNIVNNNSSINNPSANTSTGNDNQTGNNSDQIAISAIMESLMKDTAQFEADKKHHQLLQSPQPPQSPLIANSSVVTINSSTGQSQTLNASGANLIGAAQLPTCPVPQASLAEAGVVTSPVKQSNIIAGNHTNTTNPTTNRVSIQNILNAQIQQPVALRQIQQHQNTSVSPNVKVTLSQLAAQLQRPTSVVASVASVSLPSYSQALAQTQQISPGQRLVLAQQPLSNSKHQRSNPQTPTSNIETASVSNLLGGTITLAGKTLSQDAPGLQALLANTPSADNPCLQVNIGNNDLIGAVSGSSGTIVNANAPVSSSGAIGVSVGSGSLLEQLVRGQAITTNAGSISQGATNIVNSSVLSPIARSLPNPIATPVSTVNILQNNQPNINTSALPADSTNDITLAGLLAKPIVPGVSGIQHQNQNTISPAKMSPLLQQLQQPIPPPRPISNSSLPSPRQPGPGITSPRRPPTTPSPSRTNQTQQPTRSPRPSPTNFSLQQQSPRTQQGNMSVLQQQLLQQSTKQPNSILSSQLQQPLNLPASQVPIPVQELITGSNNNININAATTGTSNDISNHAQNATLNGVIGNGSQHQQNQVVSLQNLLQSGVVQVSNVASSGTYVQQVTPAINSQAGTATASIPVQLSIPGLSAPVTLSVNLPASSIPSVPSGTAPNETPTASNSVNNVLVGNNSVLVANQGALIGQGIAAQQKTVTVSNIGGKFVSNNHSAVGLTASSSGGVFLQGSTGNIIHLPQQPQQITSGALGNAAASSVTPSSLSAVANIIKPIVSIDSQAAGLANIGPIQSNQVLKSISVSAVPTSGTIGSQVLQMRQTQSGQQVYVQVPSSGVSAAGASPQSIQIVRSIPQGACNNTQQQTIVHTVQQQSLRPPSLPPPSPQQQLVTLNSALKSPVGLQTLSPQTIPPQSPLNNSNLNVVMSPPTPQQQLMGMSDANSIMLTSPGGSGGLNHSSPAVQHTNANATHMKIRAQRKQSLHNT